MNEYFHDPNPPDVLGLVAVAYAVVRDGLGRVLLVQRRDDHNWELPGGRIEIGETVAAATVREVAEEAGLRVALTAIAGVYSDPTHIVVYAREGPLQQVAIVFHARPTEPDAVSGVRPDRVETRRVAWFDPGTISAVQMHAAVRQRLVDALAHPDRPAFE